jgi:GNAT superfamily N-acetyltransferase
MSNVVYARLHPNEQMVRNAVKLVLDKSHDRRFKQEVLDFYRRDLTRIVGNHQTLDDVLIVLAIRDDVPVGLSACTILNKEKKVQHSITVVDAAARKQGIGAGLLQSKLKLLSKFYPHITVKSFVNKANEGGVKLCQKAGLIVRKEGEKVIDRGDGKKTIQYCIFGVPKK